MAAAVRSRSKAIPAEYCTQLSADGGAVRLFKGHTCTRRVSSNEVAINDSSRCSPMGRPLCLDDTFTIKFSCETGRTAESRAVGREFFAAGSRINASTRSQKLYPPFHANFVHPLTMFVGALRRRHWFSHKNSWARCHCACRTPSPALFSMKCRASRIHRSSVVNSAK